MSGPMSRSGTGKNPEIVVADIGGTNARFARASMRGDGTIDLGEPVVLGTGDFATFAEGWRAFLDSQRGFEPHGASLALAGPASQGSFKLTNADWEFDAATLLDEMAISRVSLLNDFEAIAHAVAGHASDEHLDHIAGPDDPLPRDETITVIGPGTGLGIAHFRRHKGEALIQATEGSHIDFAPVDEVDDAMLTALRKVHDRVSLERVISGEGILAIHAAIAAIEGEDVEGGQEPLSIWQLGMKGDEPISARAVAHFVKTLGRFAGDYALAHGSSAVVLAGGIGLRLHEKLKAPEFHDSFVDKGRYRAMMEAMPIKLITHPQPGLLGAAVAYFAQPHSLGQLEGRNP